LVEKQTIVVKQAILLTAQASVMMASEYGKEIFVSLYNLISHLIRKYFRDAKVRGSVLCFDITDQTKQKY